MPDYGICQLVPGTIDAVKSRVQSALKDEGFGVLTEIDAQRTLRDKLGVEMEPYLILGACNPHLAHQALDADRKIGLLLPCNVVLREVAGPQVEVCILDPVVIFSLVDPSMQEQMASLPMEARARLQRVLSRLAE